MSFGSSGSPFYNLGHIQRCCSLYYSFHESHVVKHGGNTRWFGVILFHLIPRGLSHPRRTLIHPFLILRSRRTCSFKRVSLFIASARASSASSLLLSIAAWSVLSTQVSALYVRPLTDKLWSSRLTEANCLSNSNMEDVVSSLPFSTAWHFDNNASSVTNVSFQTRRHQCLCERQ